MTKHIHAELMAQYAQDALITDTPWELWEHKPLSIFPWVRLGSHPKWIGTCEYRRNSKVINININGFEVPEPIREPLELNTLYYIPALSAPMGYLEHSWGNTNPDWKELNLGLIHLTKEAAILHAKALLSFTVKEPTQDESN